MTTFTSEDREAVEKINKPLCIYHGNCADGFTAAWVVKRAWAEAGIEVEFHAGVYNQPAPDVTGRRVIIVDFSYKSEVIKEMAKVASSILILDHHQTAIQDLEGFTDPNVELVLDKSKSGAGLAWSYYYEDLGIQPPPLLNHVQDRDLWKFELPFTREISAAIFSYEYTFENWDKLMYHTDPQTLITEGEALERKHFKDIKELLKVSSRLMYIGDNLVKAANIPYTMSSDACHILIEEGQPFGACYYDGPQYRTFSLRSMDDGPDVAKIAESYGGGGHRNASGFRVTHEQATEMCFNEN